MIRSITLDTNAHFANSRLMDLTSGASWTDQLDDGRRVDILRYDPEGSADGRHVELRHGRSTDPTVAISITFVAVDMSAIDDMGHSFEKTAGEIAIHPLEPKQRRVDFAGGDLTHAYIDWLARRLHLQFADDPLSPRAAE